MATVKDILSIAEAEIGYCEKKTNDKLDDKTANAGSGNYTKYARDLRNAGYYNGNKNGYDWCDVFFDWCMFMANGKDREKAERMQFQTGSLGASCKYSTGYYKKAGRFYADACPGDQAFFSRGHTGIVEKISAGKITLIEGNCSNKVKRMTYTYPNSQFTGFGRPNYDTEEPAVVPEVSAKETQYAATVTPENGLNVRSGPGASFSKLGALKCRTVVTVLEEKDGWGKISFNSKFGWVATGYLKKV